MFEASYMFILQQASDSCEACFFSHPPKGIRVVFYVLTVGEYWLSCFAGAKSKHKHSS